ncbi:dTDP-4-dehydrorhamnose reductase [Polymorphobacter fuscus]|uniref:dTDP-4-dehydrorhamnose reductase n=1 Tax=Sandarakinorhabdus fusca TaxID=1439888 RepID=A0A7C9KY49_9SPHN|nr:dTDP-4-dehydrorhamnose reductase [Polymorphobacter fuscus]KAB7648938.1 dTDP-4-dehydrorhamnose reductase [Polymorphobacter fuscus]MQT16528.1 dTDP-4-dehydrorhamnose reductase [Polymorphobacter fuscus]NJC07181.1 dTDP-4-dehydrorhamnose reductase [Polymorphobacter fuscus]
MKFLIAGAGGQLGRALQARVPAGSSVIAPPEADFDITDAARVADVVASSGATHLVNAAAYTAVDKAEADLEAARRINVDAVAALAVAARTAGLGFIHVSTDFVFDGTASSPYAPDAPTNPIGVYGETKRDGEIAAGADALIVRTAWVYAAAGNNFVKTMLRLMAERDEVRVVADQIGTPSHAAGLAGALWTLAGAKATGLHHWTDAGAASWYDFAVAIQEEAVALGLLARAVPVIPIRTADYPTPAQRPAYSVLDKTSSWAITGPARHWRAELRDCLATMKASS